MLWGNSGKRAALGTFDGAKGSTLAFTDQQGFYRVLVAP